MRSISSRVTFRAGNEAQGVGSRRVQQEARFSQPGCFSRSSRCSDHAAAEVGAKIERPQEAQAALVRKPEPADEIA